MKALCKECGEPEVGKRLDGLWECRACGHLFEGEPKMVEPMAKGNWKPEKPLRTTRKSSRK